MTSTSRQVLLELSEKAGNLFCYKNKQLAAQDQALEGPFARCAHVLGVVLPQAAELMPTILLPLQTIRTSHNWKAIVCRPSQHSQNKLKAFNLLKAPMLAVVYQVTCVGCH